MPGRDLTSAMSTALAERVVRPVLLGRLDILTDPVIAWTGPGVFAPSGTGDAPLDGQIFVSVAPFIQMTNIVEDQGIGGPVTLSITGQDLDEDLLRQIVRDKRQWRGRSAWLWLALLDVDEATVIADPVRIKTGIMTQIQVASSAKDAVVNVTIDRDIGNARSSAFRWVDHPRLFPADTFGTFVSKLANKPEGFESRTLVDFTPGRREGGGENDDGGNRFRDFDSF